MSKRIGTMQLKKYLLGMILGMLFLLVMRDGQVYANGTEEAASYEVEVASSTLAEVNNHMQIVIYVAAACAVCVCVVVLFLASSDARKKSRKSQNVARHIRTIYKKGREKV